MIRSGDNTIRVAGLRMGRKSIYDVYQFNFINLSGHTHEIAYAVGAGSLVPPKIVRDLLELRRLGLWFVAYFKEVNKKLAIHTIKESPRPQNELWSIAKKVVN